VRGRLIASHLMRYRDQNGQDWADVIDFLTMYPDARRQVVRLLDELAAETGPRLSGHPSAAVARGISAPRPRDGGLK
jgi:hypothetical protein